MSESLHVVELRAENIKRLRAVTIRPDGAVVIVGGKNGAGKTSTLDAIEMALAGGRAIPPEPVRRGERKGRIVVDLGELVVERTFSPKGTTLTVTGKDGAPVASPQRLLDTLCAKVAFDPLAFARMDPKQQDEVLKSALGLDFSDLDAARAQAFSARTEANRKHRDLDAQLKLAPHHPDAPTEPVSVEQLMEELERRQSLHDASSRARAVFERELEQLRKLDAKRVALQQELKAVEAAIEEQKSTVELRESEADDMLDQAKWAPLEEVKAALVTADSANRRVRENAARRKLELDHSRAKEHTDKLTETIKALDAERAERLANAKFPIPGLAFDERGPTLNGLPLEQASGAERLRVSVAIGAALNPRCKVMLVRDGSLLDDDSMELLARLAAETDSQLWVERVGTHDASAIVIEEGQVASGSAEQELTVAE